MIYSTDYSELISETKTRRKKDIRMITLYTTHCPKCRVIEKKLAQKGIGYTEVSDVEEMRQRGFSATPMLEVDGKVYNFGDANRWIMSYEGE